jgi:hypothetical protein
MVFPNLPAARYDFEPMGVVHYLLLRGVEGRELEAEDAVVAHRRVRPSTGRDCDKDMTTASGDGRHRVCAMDIGIRHSIPAGLSAERDRHQYPLT